MSYKKLALVTSKVGEDTALDQRTRWVWVAAGPPVKYIEGFIPLYEAHILPHYDEMKSFICTLLLVSIYTATDYR